MATFQLPRWNEASDPGLRSWINRFSGFVENLLSAGHLYGIHAAPSGAASGDFGGTFPGPALLQISNPTVPGAAKANIYQIYVDPADHKLKVLGPSGTVTILASP